jgi:hypothetical protein
VIPDTDAICNHRHVRWAMRAGDREMPDPSGSGDSTKLDPMASDKHGAWQFALPCRLAPNGHANLIAGLRTTCR